MLRRKWERTLVLMVVMMFWLLVASGCEKIESVSPTSGPAGQALTVTTSGDVFKDCDSSNMDDYAVYFIPSSGSAQKVTVTSCDGGSDPNKAEVEIPDFDQAATGATFKLSLTDKEQTNPDSPVVTFLSDTAACDPYPFVTTSMSDQERLGKAFFDQYFISPEGGVYINLEPNAPYTPVSPDGYPDVLYGSERQGMAMFYYVEASDCRNYVKMRNFVRNNMLSSYGLLYYLVKGDLSTTYWLSSSIDDIRVAQAMVMAYAKWGFTRDLQLAKTIAAGLRTHDSFNGTLQFADGSYWNESKAYPPENSHKVHMSYANMAAMNMLAMLPGEADWTTIRNNAGELLEGAAYYEGAEANGMFRNYFCYDSAGDCTAAGYDNDTALPADWLALTAYNLGDYQGSPINELSTRNLQFWKDAWQSSSNCITGRDGCFAGSYTTAGEPIPSTNYDIGDMSQYALVALLDYVLEDDDAEFVNTMLNCTYQLEDGQFAWENSPYPLDSWGNSLILLAWRQNTEHGGFVPPGSYYKQCHYDTEALP